MSNPIFVRALTAEERAKVQTGVRLTDPFPRQALLPKDKRRP